MDSAALELDAVKFAKTAVTYDQNAKYNEAVFYYKEAAQALIYAGMAGSKLEGIQDKVNEYLDRVQTLHNVFEVQKSDPLKSRQQVDLERAHFLVTQAFEEDEKGNGDEAIELYTQAVELCIKTSNETSDQALQTKLKQLAHQALDRAEGLKQSQSKPGPAQTQDRAGTSGAKPSSSGPVRQFFPLGPDFTLHDRQQPQPVRAVQSSEPHGQRYTSEEIEVLRSTSTINGIAYVPFMSVDLKERFAFPVPFSDKMGKLALSPKQKAIFSRWVRPDEICTSPTMIMSVSSFSIKQTVVSDCSFVASLAISAAYERRYNKKLITSIIYPQNRRGEPEYNPCGKYMVKLHINGVPRKVIIDDLLPVDRGGELLCSYSSNRNELWVSLIEKAYMKVMGGYDFPGSNSNIDLHALTGWIPERIAMHSDNQSFSKDDTFRMLFQRFHRGDVLITTATGVMTEEEGERWGLVPTHAYAVLDIREYKNMRFLQLKNPWSHLRWKGRYSERDDKNWTPELLKYLNFDPKTAQKFDNGVFWIAWEDLCQYYDVIYLSWNPALFKESTCIHRRILHRTESSSLWLFTRLTARRFTIQVYSGCKFSFSKIPNPFTHTKRVNGQWKGLSAGGCGNYKDSYKNNPIYQVQLERAGPLLIELRGSRQYSVGFEVVTVSTAADANTTSHKRSSGDYRCGFCYMEAEHVPAGIYNVIPTTFLPKQEGPFFLDFSGTAPLKVSQLQ
ncbi:calpain-7 isoform X2 [Dunckerocampus dactyliophorus]|uniref:calpain-7 isoform X2 n=1 Tax=Dunckerocampus dactyliophorus TaxID=161453 RepID=UPI0024054CA3|nr:calpain-7 isoform X2 [Dunckerocampus dactyliophorus]